MLSIILPTYNEKDSVVKTINSIIEVMPKNQRYEIIVSDDNSPDKTWEIVKKKISKNKNIHALRRMKNRGLSPAVVDGYKHAKGDYFLVMDADGQHDEKIIPEMLKVIKNNDIVIGSRYIKGGGVTDWSKTRLFISKVASFITIPVLSTRVRDPMSGFFMIKRKVFENIEQQLNSKGYKILLDVIVNSKNVKILEVPYFFKKREEGESKLSSKVIFEYIFMLIKYFIKRHITFLKFGIVGFLGTLINMGVLYLLTEQFNLFYMYSSIVAIEVSIITNFLMNNYWTWREKNKSSFGVKFLKFNLVSLATLSVNLFCLFLFTEYVGFNYLISNLIGILFGVIINFIINNRWTFKKIN